MGRTFFFGRFVVALLVPTAVLVRVRVGVRLRARVGVRLRARVGVRARESRLPATP